MTQPPVRLTLLLNRIQNLDSAELASELQRALLRGLEADQAVWQREIHLDAARQLADHPLSEQLIEDVADYLHEGPSGPSTTPTTPESGLTVHNAERR